VLRVQVLSIGHNHKGRCICEAPTVTIGLIIHKHQNPACPAAGHRGRVSCVAFSPDRKLVVSGGEENFLKVWNAESGAEVRSHLQSEWSTNNRPLMA